MKILSINDFINKLLSNFLRNLSNRVHLKIVKGQLISKTNCQIEDFPKKRTNEFVFTIVRRVFVRFLGESSA